MARIRIGTRGSKLALWQATWVAEQLTRRGHEVELVTISTSGDRSDRSLSEVGGQGVFTKEIQRALLDGQADVAVHSLKDLPTLPVPGLQLAAVPERETTDDCLISADGSSFERLAAGARVGTGSARRGAQLRHWRPDIQIVDIRGNVDSRLRKLAEGKYDAIVLAAAGLRRLRLEHVVTEVLPRDRVLPAVGQGALGLECRADDAETLDAVALLDDSDSHAAVVAERALLAHLLAGCLAPVAAIGAVAAGGALQLAARVCSLDGERVIDGQRAGGVESAEAIGRELAEHLRGLGADALIADARRDAPPHSPSP